MSGGPIHRICAGINPATFVMHLHIAFLFLLVTALSSPAEDLILSVEGAAHYARKHNPSLAAARLLIDEARGRLHHSGRLTNPEFEIEYSRHTRGRESALGASIIQRFPITSRLKSERAVSSALLAAAEAEADDAERLLAADTGAAAVRLIALKEQRDLRLAQLELSKTLETFLKKLSLAGESSQTEAAQVELESRQIEIDELQLAAEEARLSAELRILLGCNPEQTIRLSEKLAPPFTPQAFIVQNERPDVRAAQSKLLAAQAAVREQQSRRWEDIGVGASFSSERSADEPNPIETQRIVGIRLSVPLPLWSDNSGRVKEAVAAAARSEKELEAIQKAAAEDAAAARNAMEAYAKLLHELDSKVLPLAQQLEEQLRSNYSAGHSPLTDVLKAGSKRLELQRQRLDALRDYHLAKVRLNAAAFPPKSSLP